MRSLLITLPCADQTESGSTTAAGNPASSVQYPDIRSETRFAVNTATAAHWLMRERQTLRIWACKDNGPIRPIRINGRLAWPVAKIRRILGVESQLEG